MLFIYWLEGNPQFGKRVDAIWSRMQGRNDQLITAALAFGEVFAGAYRRGANQERVQKVRAGLEIAVSEVIPFTSETAGLDWRIRGSLRVSSAYAIHLAAWSGAC